MNINITLKLEYNEKIIKTQVRYNSLGLTIFLALSLAPCDRKTQVPVATVSIFFIPLIVYFLLFY